MFKCGFERHVVASVRGEAGLLTRLHAEIYRNILHPYFLAAGAHRSRSFSEILCLEGRARQQPAPCRDAVVRRQRRLNADRADQLIGYGAGCEDDRHARRDHGKGHVAALFRRQGLYCRKFRFRPPPVFHHATIRTQQRDGADDCVVFRRHRRDFNTSIAVNAGRKVMRADMDKFRVIGIGEVFSVNFPIPRQGRIRHGRRHGHQVRVLITLPEWLQLREAGAERRRVFVKRDKQKTMPVLQPDNGEPDRIAQAVMDCVIVNPGRRDKATFQVVAPEMQRTAKRPSCRPGFGRNDLSPVLTDGAHRADAAVLSPDNQ